MPEKESPPRKVVLKIGELRRYARPKNGPEDQPPADLIITNLTLTRETPSPPGPPPPAKAAPAAPPERPPAKPAGLAKIIPLWAHPESRRWLLRKVFLPSFLFLLLLSLILIAANPSP